MKITRLSGPEVQLELSADEWQLYSLDGRDAAAEALNRGLEQRIKQAPTRSDFHLGDLLSPHSNFGACDSEGFWTVERILDKVYGKPQH